MIAVLLSVPRRDGARDRHRGTGDGDRASSASSAPPTGVASPAPRIALTLVIVAGAHDRHSPRSRSACTSASPAPTRPRSPTSPRAAAGNGALFALFQASSAPAPARRCELLLPGRARACSRPSRAHPKSAGVGILPRSLGEANHHHTPVTGRSSSTWRSPPWSSSPPAATSRSWCFLRGGRLRQLPGRAGRDGAVLAPRPPTRPGGVNIAGALAVAFTLVVNLGRGYPLLSLAATAVIAAALYALWVRAGDPPVSSRSKGTSTMIERHRTAERPVRPARRPDPLLRATRMLATVCRRRGSARHSCLRSRSLSDPTRRGSLLIGSAGVVALGWPVSPCG